MTAPQSRPFYIARQPCGCVSATMGHLTPDREATFAQWRARGWSVERNDAAAGLPMGKCVQHGGAGVEVGKLRVLDLFSGIGGFSLGLERTGDFETVGFVEIDPFCRRVLAKHWPDVPQFEDVRNVTDETLRQRGVDEITVLTGGFPCQPFSSAGKQRGTNDERHLWPEIIRLVREIRPRYIILENVPNLLAIDRGRVFGTILGELAEVGFDAEWQVLSAAAFGAPHLRERLWIVAYPALGDNAGQHRKRGNRRSPHGQERAGLRDRTADAGNVPGPLADANSERQSQSQGNVGQLGRRSIHSREALAHADQPGPQRRAVFTERPDQWLARQSRMGNAASEGLPDWTGGAMGQPSPLTEFERPGGREIERDFRGVSYGVSERVAKLAALGNSLVWLIPQYIGDSILAAEGRG